MTNEEHNSIIVRLLNWANDRWNAEVKDRPMVNVHRRTLDETWNQVMRKLESEMLPYGVDGSAAVDGEGKS